MYRTPRRLWGLLAVGGATAVGITTHDAGLVILTLLGTLALPRILGIRGPGWRHAGGGCHGHGGRWKAEDRMAEWHRQAHAEPPGAAPVA